MISPVSTSVETSAAAAPVTGCVGDRLLGDRLQGRVERRVDLEPAVARPSSTPYLSISSCWTKSKKYGCERCLVVVAAVEPEAPGT